MRIPAPNFWPAARTGQRLLLQARRHETMVDGHKMVFLERGSPGVGRPTIVLIHGFAAMKENFLTALGLSARDAQPSAIL